MAYCERHWKRCEEEAAPLFGRGTTQHRAGALVRDRCDLLMRASFLPKLLDLCWAGNPGTSDQQLHLPRRIWAHLKQWGAFIKWDSGPLPEKTFFLQTSAGTVRAA
ncbi:TPA: hypothetical protein ACH3X2_001173 [Trebouxia sp. C0005]